MELETRISMMKQIADYYGIKRNVDYAKFFEISEPLAFNRVKTGYMDFEEIYNRCPDISAEWLLSGGHGPMLRTEREAMIASQNTNIGDGANQHVSVGDGKRLEEALAALAREQEALARAQEQISGLIDIIRGNNK